MEDKIVNLERIEAHSFHPLSSSKPFPPPSNHVPLLCLPPLSLLSSTTDPIRLFAEVFPHIYCLRLVPMKRTIHGEVSKMKKIRIERGVDEEEEGGGGAGVMQNLDENLLFEVLKHVDARTLALASCVSKLWHRTAQDERLWELICTRQWANIGCGNQQLRSVVLALGGFRRLHSVYLLPLSKPKTAASSTSSSAWPTAPAPFPTMVGAKPPARWGKDEVHLSLSLLSIRYYEKMNFSSRGR